MRVNLLATRNGWVVIQGDLAFREDRLTVQDFIGNSWSFDSIEKCLEQVRQLIEEWHKSAVKTA
jgi:hypothetical protein